MSHFGKICRDLVIWVLAQFVEARFVDWPKAALQSSSADGSSRSRYSPPTGWSLGQPGSLQEYLLLSPFQSFMAVGHELDVSKVQVHTHVAIPITPETIALMEFTTTRSPALFVRLRMEARRHIKRTALWKRWSAYWPKL